VQTVLVLGGGSEIGAAIAERLVAGGARTVVLAGRHPDDLGATVDRLTQAGATTVDTVAFDADDTDGHAKVVDEVVGRHGDLDVVVVAFGVLGDQAEAETDPAAAVQVATTNYVGAVSALTVVADRLRAQGHGDIVVLSSVAGERVRRANYVYGSTKAGLDGFCQGLAAALAGSGVHLLTVRPGFVKTHMTAGLAPAPMSTTAEVVADVTMSGLRRRARVVWAPPALRWVFVVMRHLPTAVFRRLPG
jgi:NAD(P)-dependent dehydrogenase (short-subunit alcohol dehydrogenase family)